MSIRFDDALTTRGTGDVSDAEAWFDRAYFNIFAGIERPAVVLGGAHHPNADRGRGVSDGYIVVLHEGQQRNLRFSEPGAVSRVVLGSAFRGRRGAVRSIPGRHGAQLP